MAIFHGLNRPRTLNDAAQSGDNALNVLIMVLLIAFGVATWYFYATPMADGTNAGAAVTLSAPTHLPTHPSP